MNTVKRENKDPENTPIKEKNNKEIIEGKKKKTSSKIIKKNEAINNIDDQECVDKENIEIIPEELIEILGGERNSKQIKKFASFFRGPLPPPSILAGYNQVKPGLADRIVKMAEKQQDHRINVVGKIVGSDINQSRNALIFAFIIALLIVGCGLFLIIRGNDVSGFILVISALVPIIYAFLKKVVFQSEHDLESKKEK